MRQQDSSFCEQKEAKKLFPFAAAQTAENGAVLCRSRMDEVFLVLFVHKKNAFS